LEAAIAAQTAIVIAAERTRQEAVKAAITGGMSSTSAAAAAARGVGSEQRQFAQSALGRYLPPEIARAIIKDPDRLKLTGERRTIHALFSDIEGFTTLTHAIEPERTAALLNAYLDRISNVVLEHGGTIDKFVGDSVVAFWGAPLSRETDAENAVRAAIAIARVREDRCGR
jgi:adenylate cyclase